MKSAILFISFFVLLLPIILVLAPATENFEAQLDVHELNLTTGYSRQPIIADITAGQGVEITGKGQYTISGKIRTEEKREVRGIFSIILERPESSISVNSSAGVDVTLESIGITDVIGMTMTEGTNLFLGIGEPEHTNSKTKLSEGRLLLTKKAAAPYRIRVASAEIQHAGQSIFRGEGGIDFWPDISDTLALRMHSPATIRLNSILLSNKGAVLSSFVLLQDLDLTEAKLSSASSPTIYRESTLSGGLIRMQRDHIQIEKGHFLILDQPSGLVINRLSVIKREEQGLLLRFYLSGRATSIGTGFDRQIPVKEIKGSVLGNWISPEIQIAILSFCLATLVNLAFKVAESFQVNSEDSVGPSVQNESD